jgi:hypothetical protein
MRVRLGVGQSFVPLKLHTFVVLTRLLFLVDVN